MLIGLLLSRSLCESVVIVIVNVNLCSSVTVQQVFSFHLGPTDSQIKERERERWDFSSERPYISLLNESGVLHRTISL